MRKLGEEMDDRSVGGRTEIGSGDISLEEDIAISQHCS